MSSVKQMIDNQNKKKLNSHNASTSENEKTKPCNCRNKENCSLLGECLQSGVIYQI